MKKISLLLPLLLILSLGVIAKEKGNMENVMPKFKMIMKDSRFFAIKSAQYDKGPLKDGGTGIYKMELKVKGKKGKGVFTFVKFPLPDSLQKGDQSINPVYETVTFELIQYSDKKRSMEKEQIIPLHLREPQVIAVYRGQKLFVTWQGDGGFGAKGFHLYSYKEYGDGDN